jgi:hypothetical protein
MDSGRVVKLNSVRRLRTLSAVLSTSVRYVMQRMAQTVVPHAQTGQPAYTSNSCHAQVSRGILKRGNPEDRVYLFGSEGGDVIHSVLADENSKVIVDAWPHGRFMGTHGYKSKDELLPCLYSFPVSELYDLYQR